MNMQYVSDTAKTRTRNLFNCFVCLIIIVNVYMNIEQLTEY